MKMFVQKLLKCFSLYLSIYVFNQGCIPLHINLCISAQKQRRKRRRVQIYAATTRMLRPSTAAVTKQMPLICPRNQMRAAQPPNLSLTNHRRSMQLSNPLTAFHFSFLTFGYSLHYPAVAPARHGFRFLQRLSPTCPGLCLSLISWHTQSGLVSISCYYLFIFNYRINWTEPKSIVIRIYKVVSFCEL